MIKTGMMKEYILLSDLQNKCIKLQYFFFKPREHQCTAKWQNRFLITLDPRKVRKWRDWQLTEMFHFVLKSKHYAMSCICLKISWIDMSLHRCLDFRLNVAILTKHNVFLFDQRSKNPTYNLSSFSNYVTLPITHVCSGNCWTFL